MFLKFSFSFNLTQSFLYIIIQIRNFEKGLFSQAPSYLGRLPNSYKNGFEKTSYGWKDKMLLFVWVFTRYVLVLKCAAEHPQFVSFLEFASLAVTLVSLTVSSSAIFLSRTSPSTWKPTMSW